MDSQKDAMSLLRTVMLSNPTSSHTPQPVDSIRLHNIATGVSSLHNMYTEMSELEMRKDVEIASLHLRIQELERLCAAACEREAYLVEAAEKLERKLQRRDATIAALEAKLLESRLGAGETLQQLEALQRDLADANKRALRADMDSTRLDRFAQLAADDHASSMEALALSERLLVELRSKFLVADPADLNPHELSSLATALSDGYADTAFRTAMVCVTECRLAVSSILATCVSDASSDMGAHCRALLEVLRLQCESIGDTCRNAFFSTTLALPLVSNLRRSLNAPCEGDCALVAHRCFAACEEAFRQGIQRRGLHQ